MSAYLIFKNALGTHTYMPRSRVVGYPHSGGTDAKRDSRLLPLPVLDARDSPVPVSSQLIREGRPFETVKRTNEGRDAIPMLPTATARRRSPKVSELAIPVAVTMTDAYLGCSTSRAPACRIGQLAAWLNCSRIRPRAALSIMIAVVA